MTAPTLGDSFSAQHKSLHFDKICTPGAVFKIFFKDIAHPKIKRFVILGFDGSGNIAGVSLINTNLSQTALFSEKLRVLHVPLLAKNNQYIDHDSYLDCSWIHDQSVSVLKQEYLQNTSIYLGRTNEKDIAIALRTVAKASTISPKIKKKFGFIKGNIQ